MCAYFLKTLFAPFSMLTIAEAHAATCEFFCETVHEGGRQLFTRILKASAAENRVNIADNQTRERMPAVCDRMQEYLLLEDLEFQRGEQCTFDDPIVQLAIGSMYRTGDQVRRDHQKAVEWLARAAAQNEIRALSLLGRMYLEGDGVAIDSEQALSLLTKAADLGDDSSAAIVGSMYCTGRGVAKDYHLGTTWLKKAAMLGSAHAQGQLGYLYSHGLGVDCDLIEAFAWTHLSAEAGAEFGVKNLPILSSAMTAQERDRALARAADLGAALMASTAHWLTPIDLVNKALKSEGPEAVKWFRMAAERGHADAAYWLANCYVRGNGVRADAHAAFQWYVRAANGGNGNALFSLVVAYMKGEGVDRDPVTSLMYFYLAEEHAFRGGYNADRQETRDSFRRYNYIDAYAIASELNMQLPPGTVDTARRMAANSKITLPPLPPLSKWVCSWDE